MFGSWEVNVQVNKFPQKIASAVDNLNIVGAEYDVFAYLGSQQVNGVNHAVIAEQTLTTGKDVKNIVLLIFREVGDEVTLANIERIVEGGSGFGGTNIDVKTEVPAEASDVLAQVISNWVGSTITPIAFLGTQVTKGTDFIFLAKVTPVTQDPKDNVAIIKVNPMTKSIAFADILKSSLDASLGYAFTWLKG